MPLRGWKKPFLRSWFDKNLCFAYPRMENLRGRGRDGILKMHWISAHTIRVAATSQSEVWKSPSYSCKRGLFNADKNESGFHMPLPQWFMEEKLRHAQKRDLKVSKLYSQSHGCNRTRKLDLNSCLIPNLQQSPEWRRGSIESSIWCFTWSPIIMKYYTTFQRLQITSNKNV